MTTSSPQLDTLRRIVSQVRLFRENPDHLKQGAYGQHLNEYLKQHLSTAEYEVWEALELDWETSKV
jgi:hypothetical protein